MPLQLPIHNLEHVVEVTPHLELQRGEESGAAKAMNQSRASRGGLYKVAFFHRKQPLKSPAKGHLPLNLKICDAGIDG